jgi:trimethylamine--corrinoid protein Co-methyltransferase
VLAEYEAPPLDEAVGEALQDFITREKALMGDAG